MRHAINWRAVLPFIVGGALGVPAGTALLTTVDQGTLRLTMGVLLVIYSLYSLIRPTLKPVEGGVTTELGVGIANGLIGGLTGLGGIAVTVWCQLRGGPKDAQRAIFQPVMFATFVMSAISFARRPRIYSRNAQALCACASRSDWRHLVWVRALWKT